MLPPAPNHCSCATWQVGRLFELKARKTTFSRELCAALTVFLTVSEHWQPGCQGSCQLLPPSRDAPRLATRGTDASPLESLVCHVVSAACESGPFNTGVANATQVAQIIAVNPAIVSASGGPCTIDDCTVSSCHSVQRRCSG